MYTPTTRTILKVFLMLCSAVNLSKHNIHALFGSLKQFFNCFYHSIFEAHSVILWNSPFVHSVYKLNTAYFNHSCNVFTCLLNKQKMLVPEVEYGLTCRPDLD